MTFVALTGICQQGPWHGKVRTFRTRRVGVSKDGVMSDTISPDDAGAYYYRQPSGPTPGAWVWVENPERT